MEGLVDLLPLLFIAVYYLLAGRRRARLKREAAQREAETRVETTGQPVEVLERTPFQSFLQQLEEAVAEAGGIEEDDRIEVEPPPAPPPPVVADVVPVKPVVERPVSALGREFRPVGGSFDAAKPVDHEAHGFGRDNPLSEEVFERAPAFARRPATAPRQNAGVLRQPPAPAPQRTNWRHLLDSPEAARNAFVLQTIFGRRGGRREK